LPYALVTSQKEVESVVEDLAPTSLAEDWDNVGWQVRSDSDEVTGILCAVDATEAVVDEAAELGANLVLAHHPLLFRPLRSVDVESRVGAVIAKAILRGISILSAHTNWDAAPGGISWALAKHLGLQPLEPLLPVAGSSNAGLGVIAESTSDLHAAQLVALLGSSLGSAVTSWVGPTTEGHRRVALMGGSGTTGIAKAAASGATLYITADVRYHDAQEAEAVGLSLLVVDHGASERPGMSELGRILATRLAVPVTSSQTPTSPWRFITDATD
jgi:dinuclear metal center YbgI/SA1388 family protein